MHTRKYREWYQKERANKDEFIDLDFIGCYKKDNNNNIVKKGFIELTHGDKENIRNFIESQVKIAEDGQAIYEFLQNAVDANSTVFSVYYDTENFLVINNGKKFDLDNTKSILNFSQSTKTEEDEKIGKFGVGFKLIHRLVGNDSGIDEIIEQYKGPILFSWDDFYIEKFLQNDFKDIDKHWLYKIIYTNFPCGVDEEIKNELYKSIKPFSKSDLNNMIEFIRNQNINLDELKSGSLFFLKLGKEKEEVLDTEKDDLKTGISTSLNILNYLRKQKQGINSITINTSNIKSDNLHLISNEKYIFLYPPLKYAEKYYKTIDEKISFFKFFPMGDQTNKLNFIIHHYKFEVETNRRKLQKNGIINQNILKDTWEDLKLKLDGFKKEKKEQFVDIIANLYLSDLKNANNKDMLIINSFTNYALQYITANIPYKDTNSYGIDSFNTTNDKSKIIVVDSLLHDIPLKNKHHFYFDPKKYKDIVREACIKLDLIRWTIVDVIINDYINNWILKLTNNNFSKLLKEIEEKKKHNSQPIVDIWKGTYTLDETKRILQIFNRLDNNIKFAISKNEKNSYSVISDSHNHYIKNNIFKDFLSEYDLESIEYYLIPDEFEEQILNIVGKASSDKEILDYFLQTKQHKEIIGFVEHYDMEEIFLNTLARLDLDTSKKYEDDCYELKVLDFILKYNNLLDTNKEKLYINDNQISKLSKSPYITFKYKSNNSSKVINPNSYDSDEKNSEEILDFIKDFNDKYKTIFNIQEESKDKVYAVIRNEIQNNYKLNNKINTKNRLKFIMLYSLEKDYNYIQDFNGINIYNHDKQEDESIFRLYKILKNDIQVKDEKQFDIFNISSFFPQTLNKDYYIKDRSLAIGDEKLPNNIEDKYTEVFEKIGLKIDSDLPKIRKKVIDKEEINSDDISKFSQQQLVNTFRFLQVVKTEYSIDNDEIENIKKLFQKVDETNKKTLEYFPTLQSKQNISFQRVETYSVNKNYIKKETLKNKNKEFQNRLNNEIKTKEIIYIDIMSLDNIPSSWNEIKENEYEKIDSKKKELDKKDLDIDMMIEKIDKTDDKQRRWAIGWKGEKYIYTILIDKFGIDNVKWGNEYSRSIEDDPGGIDLELNVNGKTHNIEVKTTINSVKNDNQVQFTMSSKQYQAAISWGRETHLFFVTGIETNNPKHLYMNFDNNWIDTFEKKDEKLDLNKILGKY